MLKNERNVILRKNCGEEFEKSYVPLHGSKKVKNFQNHPDVIIEWPLTLLLHFKHDFSYCVTSHIIISHIRS